MLWRVSVAFPCYGLVGNLLKECVMRTYMVFVNDVHSGDLSGEDYADMKKNQYRNAHNYIMQTLNIMYTAYSFAVRSLCYSVILTLMLLLGIVVVPHALTSAEVHQMFLHPVQFVDDIRQVFYEVAFFTPMFLLLAEAFAHGRIRGFVNYFNKGLALDIRRRIGVAADGDVRLLSIGDES